jgi:hypothetical protein
MLEAHREVDLVRKYAAQFNTEDFHCKDLYKDVYRHISVITIWKIWTTKIYEVLGFNANFIRKENSIMSRAVYKHDPSIITIQSW